MSAPSVDREIEANEQRANDGDDGEDDNGSIVGGLENVVNPLSGGLGTSLGGDGDDGDVDPDQQRRLNDADQRPG